MVNEKNEQVMVHAPLVGIDGSIRPESVLKCKAKQKQPDISKTDKLGAAMDNQVNMGESLTIQEVSEVLTNYKTAADMANVIALEVSGLSRVDGAGVQLLCAIFKEAGNQHIDITWNGQSDALNSAADQLGVAGYLHLSMKG